MSLSKRHSALIAAFLLLCLPLNATAAEKRFRNVIVLLMDGTGSAHTTISRWYKGAPLALDRMALGGVRTYSADSVITDSAPAATAFATGHKTGNKLVGVLPGKVFMPGVEKIPDHDRFKPVATVLEGARLMGKAVGLVATSNIQHASPAAYSAHWPARNDFNEIAEQQVYGGIDVVLGGGAKYLVPLDQGGTRDDRENLIQVLNSRGYRIARNREELAAAAGSKVWGVFADEAMSCELDRNLLAPEQPSLREMTSKAIEILSRNRKGFFLFVEGSKIDWASHANDPVGVISEVLAFDGAVDAALKFAAKDGKTLVLAFSDHGNGGMSLGSSASNGDYSTFPLKKLLEPLRKARLTGEGVEQALRDAGPKTPDLIRDVVAKYYGIDDLTQSEVEAIANAKDGRLNDVLGPMMSSRSAIGWTTGGHVGEDLFFYFYGLEKPVGMIENTEIARICARALGTNLDLVGKRLFVDAEKAFGSKGAAIRIDSSNAANPVLMVQKGKNSAVLPFSKDIIRLKGKRRAAEYKMEGLTIFSPPTGKVYVPEEAVRVFNRYIRN